MTQDELLIKITVDQESYTAAFRQLEGLNKLEMKWVQITFFVGYTLGVVSSLIIMWWMK